MDGLMSRRLARLAPTPSGYLHRGNAINFLVTARLASLTKARLLLRIDDLDAERVRPEYVEDIFRSLDQLGIRWDDGPSGPGELSEQWSQQLRMPRYLALLEVLRDRGVLYACTCSRKDLRAASQDGQCPGTCRDRGLSLDTPDAAWRLRLPLSSRVKVPPLHGPGWELDLHTAMGDPVLRQRQGRPAYQVASLVDDEHMGVDLVVRGADLLPSSACQLYMAQLVGLPTFAKVRFVHHGLVLDAAGGKLSKSAGAASLKAMRDAGIRPDGLFREADRVVEVLLANSASEP
jgi:glutamyl/glutaminyl-tRNA synthetase